MQKILGIWGFAVYIFRPTTDLRIHVEQPELFSNKKEREKILRIPWRLQTIWWVNISDIALTICVLWARNKYLGNHMMTDNLAELMSNQV